MYSNQILQAFLLSKTHASLPNIEPINDLLISQIAAGEVVERPASIIKELLENALDAGAQNIVITLDKGGIERICVQDDGCGMLKEQLALALQRHASSKVKSLEDLNELQSFGFRGEALASMAACALLTLSSRPRGQDIGYQLTTQADIKPYNMDYGSIVDIQSLFYQTPARLKFLKSSATEALNCMEMVRRFALVNPHVAFNATHGKQQVQFTHGDLTHRLGQFFGLDFIEHAYSQFYEYANCQLLAFLGHPHQAKLKQNEQIIILNGRLIKDKVISHAIKQVYQDILHGQYPSYVLYLQVPYDMVDVNVHPAKTEVRFKDTQLIHQLVYHGLKNAFRQTAHQTQAFLKAIEQNNTASNLSNPLNTLNQLSDDTKKIENIHTIESVKIEQNETQSLLINYDTSNNTTNINETNTIGIPKPTPKFKASLNFHPQNFNKPSANQTQQTILKENTLHTWQQLQAGQNLQNQSMTLEAPKWPNLDSQEIQAAMQAQSLQGVDKVPKLGYAIAQLHFIYILAQNDLGLVLVDMHAAHERIIYEKLKKQFKQQTLIEAKQAMLVPYVLPCGMLDKACIEQYKDLFKRIGFDLSWQNQDLVIEAVPIYLQKMPIIGVMHSLLDCLKQYGNISAEHVIERYQDEIIASIACHSAKRAKESLSIQEMNALLRLLENTPSSEFCNHGRPTWHVLSIDSLDKLFLRGK